MVYGLIVYAMIGFEWNAAKLFWYLFFMYFTLLCYTYFGMMAVAMTPNQQVASIVSSAFYSIWNLFSGFIIPRPVSTYTSIYYFRWFMEYSFIELMLFNFPSFVCDRKFLCGGDGMLGQVQRCTHCMD